MSTSKNIAIFASGSGSNAEAIFNYFKGDGQVKVSRLLSNNMNAYALTRAKNHGIATMVFDRKQFYEGQEIADLLLSENTDLIVLAGFLWLVPETLLRAFPNKIVNIHPALLPKHGGKGMYGMHIHRAVKAAGDTESGITIHYVNGQYDDGQIILQECCELDASDSPENIAGKVLKLEHHYYPQAIDKLVRS